VAGVRGLELGNVPLTKSWSERFGFPEIFRENCERADRFGTTPALYTPLFSTPLKWVVILAPLAFAFLFAFRVDNPRFWTILDSIYARARVNVNLELSRSGNGVRERISRGSGQFAKSALGRLHRTRVQRCFYTQGIRSYAAGRGRPMFTSVFDGRACAVA
jgi:hypothetical protein